MFEFDVSVPREADIATTKKKITTTPPAGACNRNLRFEYDLAAAKLTLNEDYVTPAPRPRWATVSPDEQTVIFARNHNLSMMDAANWAKAQKNANDASIVETAGEHRHQAKNNIYNNTWSEKNHGIREVEKDGKITFEFSIEKNSELARKPEGAPDAGHGGHRVHPANTYRLADALIKANKRFDLMILPGIRHGFGAVGPDVNQRRADYFVRHLLGNTQKSVDIVELNREQQQTGPRAR